MTIRNPILRGFNPDPSIVRVDEDYFIATSTFEWFPGVQIHQSRDLTNWRLVARPLNRARQLDMRGNPDSCGVWAPDLSYAAGRFHLVYTDVKRYGRTTVGGANGASLRDFHNYWVWSDTIDGEWSDPVYLNSSGFDPALFHDDDGTTWLLNMLWDHRPERPHFAGVVAQQMDLATGGLIGKRHRIFAGTPLGFTEGPHLYKRDGWYHLLVAEGGTGWNHAVVMARSRSLLGPYEVHPDGAVLTSADKPHAPLARAGHGDLVETASGETWMAYLCGRPLAPSNRCVLGRETAIQRMQWGEDGWLRTEDGSGTPLAAIDDGAAESETATTSERYTFDAARLPDVFQWLRTPYPQHLFSLTERPGFLRLYGREMIGSAFNQSLVARRQQAFRYTAETSLEAEPGNFQQGAGLICYYNSSKFHFLQLTAGDDGERQLQVMSAIPREGECGLVVEAAAIPPGPLSLRVEVDHELARFAYRVQASDDWRWLPASFDASLLSDEVSLPGLPNFTGAFVGMACYDLSGAGMAADFADFTYRERE